MEVLTNQLRKALGSVAQDVIAPLTTERAIEVIEKAPEQWITSHAEVLYKQYNVDSLFGNQAYLTSVDNTTKRKLLGLFLALLETDLHESWNKNAKTFLTEISKGDFLDTLDENLLQDLIHTLSDHWDQWFPTKDPDDMFLRRLWRRSRRKTR